MKKIFVFDDRPQTRLVLEEQLSEIYDVISCATIYEANDKWASIGHLVDAVIIDILVPPRGLTVDLINETKGRVITGWICLWKQVKKCSITTHPNLDFCTILYSG